MADKKHERIGTEGKARSGAYSEDRTNELQAQLEPFYDFRSSFLELKDKRGRLKEKDRQEAEAL